MTPIETSTKAASVPILTSAPSVTSGRKNARIAAATPVMIVILCGVRKVRWTRENQGGSRWSLLIAKATRLWPSTRIMTTVSPIRIARETMSCAAGKGVASSAVAAGAAVASVSYGTSPVKTMEARM